jgi:hypothetical protein
MSAALMAKLDRTRPRPQFMTSAEEVGISAISAVYVSR